MAVGSSPLAAVRSAWVGHERAAAAEIAATINPDRHAHLDTDHLVGELGGHLGGLAATARHSARRVRLLAAVYSDHRRLTRLAAALADALAPPEVPEASNADADPEPAAADSDDRSEVPDIVDPATTPARCLVAAPTGPPLAA